MNLILADLTTEYWIDDQHREADARRLRASAKEKTTPRSGLHQRLAQTAGWFRVARGSAA
jgi:hypothetical protein